MASYRVRNNQSVYDLAIQLYGSVDYAVQVLEDNNTIITDLNDIIEANAIITYTIQSNPVVVDFALQGKIVTTQDLTEEEPPDLAGAFFFWTQHAIPLDGPFIATVTEIAPSNPRWILQEFSTFSTPALNITSRGAPFDLETTELNGTEQQVALLVDVKANEEALDLSSLNGTKSFDTTGWTSFRTLLFNDNLFEEPVIASWFNNINTLIEAESNNWSTSVINSFLAHILTVNNISTATGRVIDLLSNATGDASTVPAVQNLKSSFNITTEIAWFDGLGTIARKQV